MSFDERLFSLMQYVLPQRALTAAMYRLTRCRRPWFKNALIRSFTWFFNIDLNQAVIRKAADYPHFNAFFTRALRPEARPLDHGEQRLISPVDGRVSQAGLIRHRQLFQAKGHYYELETLVGGDPQLTRLFTHGHFATLYLSPRDYHRIHMPLGGRLKRMIHVPGSLFSVNQATARHIPGLFARNERLICLFDTPAGPMAMILVGAIFVASMETAWAGEITPSPRQSVGYWDYAQGPELAQGDEMGRFNMGSTVIMLFPEHSVEWNPELTAGWPLKMGEAIGRWQRPAG